MMVRARTIPTLLCLLVLAAARIAVAMATAGPVPPPPDLLQRVGLDQQLGAQLPLDERFRNANGQTTSLREALGGRPGVLVLGYYRCTNLCEAVRAGVAQAVTGSGLRPAEQFNVVFLSIDPREVPQDAAAAKRADELAHPHAHVGEWRYLVGTPAASAAVARAIGFRDFFDARTGQYAHSAGIVVVSAAGEVSQYLLGVQFSPLTLRLALISASRGRIGSLVEQLVLLCCAYDSSTGHYSLLIDRVLQGLGILTLLTLSGLVAVLRRRELRAQQQWPT
jgi:protein SCO1